MHTTSVTKWLTDPDADNTPFPHQIGKRLQSQSKNLAGMAKNAKYVDTEGGGHPGEPITAKQKPANNPTPLK